MLARRKKLEAEKARVAWEEVKRLEKLREERRAQAAATSTSGQKRGGRGRGQVRCHAVGPRPCSSHTLVVLTYIMSST